MQKLQEMQIWSLGQKNPLEKQMATHSSILAWKIPWTEEPDGLKSMVSQTVRHDRVTEHTRIFFSMLNRDFTQEEHQRSDRLKKWTKGGGKKESRSPTISSQKPSDTYWSGMTLSKSFYLSEFLFFPLQKGVTGNGKDKYRMWKYFNLLIVCAHLLFCWINEIFFFYLLWGLIPLFCVSSLWGRHQNP